MGTSENRKKMGKTNIAAVLKYQDKQRKKLSLTDKKLLSSN